MNSYTYKKKKKTLSDREKRDPYLHKKPELTQVAFVFVSDKLSQHLYLIHFL